MFGFFFTYKMKGGRVFAPLIISIIAYILFAITAFSCDSFEFRYPQDDSSNQKYGYWGYIDVTWSGKETCHSWNDLADDWVSVGGSKNEVIDAPLKVGRGIGVAGAVLGGLFLILIALTPFMVIHKSIFITSGNIVGIFMGLFSPALYAGLFTEGCVEEDGDNWNDYYDDGRNNYYSDSESSSTLHCAPTVKGYLASGAFLLWIISTSLVCCCMGNPRSTEATTEDDVQFTMETDKEYAYANEERVAHESHNTLAGNHSEGNNTDVEVEGVGSL